MGKSLASQNSCRGLRLRRIVGKSSAPAPATQCRARYSVVFVLLTAVARYSVVYLFPGRLNMTNKTAKHAHAGQTCPDRLNMPSHHGQSSLCRRSGLSCIEDTSEGRIGLQNTLIFLDSNHCAQLWATSQEVPVAILAQVGAIFIVYTKCCAPL